MAIKILSNHENIQKQSKRLKQEVGGGLFNGTLYITDNFDVQDESGSCDVNIEIVAESSSSITAIILFAIDGEDGERWALNYNKETKVVSGSSFGISLTYSTEEVYQEGEMLYVNYVRDGSDDEYVPYNMSTATRGTRTDGEYTPGSLLDNTAITYGGKERSGKGDTEGYSGGDAYMAYIKIADPV